MVLCWVWRRGLRLVSCWLSSRFRLSVWYRSVLVLLRMLLVWLRIRRVMCVMRLVRLLLLMGVVVLRLDVMWLVAGVWFEKWFVEVAWRVKARGSCILPMSW